MGLTCDLVAVEIAFMCCLHPCKKSSQKSGKGVDFAVENLSSDLSLTMIDV